MQIENMEIGSENILLSKSEGGTDGKAASHQIILCLVIGSLSIFQG